MRAIFILLTAAVAGCATAPLRTKTPPICGVGAAEVGYVIGLGGGDGVDLDAADADCAAAGAPPPDRAAFARNLAAGRYVAGFEAPSQVAEATASGAPIRNDAPQEPAPNPLDDDLFGGSVLQPRTEPDPEARARADRLRRIETRQRALARERAKPTISAERGRLLAGEAARLERERRTTILERPGGRFDGRRAF